MTENSRRYNMQEKVFILFERVKSNKICGTLLPKIDFEKFGKLANDHHVYEPYSAQI